jgi:MTA/SAH nucleosidase
MKIGIVAAMRKEFELLVAALSDTQQREYGPFYYAWGTLGQHQVAIVLSGIGKVHAALGTAALIQHASVDCLLSIGCSGGLLQTLKPTDVVVASACCYHDVWCGEPNQYGQIQGCPPVFRCHARLTEALEATLHAQQGLLACGEYFIPTESNLRAILTHFPQTVAVDMESAAVAQTAWITATPFATVRAISDTPISTDDHQAQYDRFWREQARMPFDRIMEGLATLPDTLDLSQLPE